MNSNIAQKDELFTPRGYVGKPRFFGQNISAVAIEASDLQWNTTMLTIALSSAVFAFFHAGLSFREEDVYLLGTVDLVACVVSCVMAMLLSN